MTNDLADICDEPRLILEGYEIIQKLNLLRSEAHDVLGEHCILKFWGQLQVAPYVRIPEPKMNIGNDGSTYMAALDEAGVSYVVMHAHQRDAKVPE